MNAPTRAELVQLVRDLAAHLDWVGWGDSWERECSTELRGDVERMLPKLAAELAPDGFLCLTVRPDLLVPCARIRAYVYPQPNRCVDKKPADISPIMSGVFQRTRLATPARRGRAASRLRTAMPHLCEAS